MGDKTGVGEANSSAAAGTAQQKHGPDDANVVRAKAFDDHNEAGESRENGTLSQADAVELAPLGSIRDVEKQAEPALEQTTSHASTLPMSRARAIAMVTTLSGAAFLNTLSVQAAVIALPSIGRDLKIPAARQQWIISAYSLAFGCFLLLWGRLGDVYGKRLIFIYGSAWVCIVTIICPFIPNEIGFDIFRGLQGLGAAANVPTAIGILGVTFPPGKAKNYAFATYSAGAPMGGVCGNILAGLVIQYSGSWKPLFYVLSIIAGIVTVAGYFVIPLPVLGSKPPIKNAVDWLGGTTITIALFALMFALTEGNVVGWGKPYIGVIIAISGVLIALFVLWQLYLEKRTNRPPLLKVTIFKNYRVSAAMFTTAMFFASFNNYLVFATMYYQDFHGRSPIQTTLRFLPTGAVGIFAVSVISQILGRVPVNYILIFGTTCITLSSLLFAIPIPINTSYWAYGFPAMCLCVLGADTLFPSLILFNAHSLPREDQALGGATINAVGQIGRAVGLAIGTAIQVAVQEGKSGSARGAVTGAGDYLNMAFLAGLRAASWFDAAMALCALGVVTVAFRNTGVIGRAKM